MRVFAGAAAAGVSPSVYALVGGGAPSNRRATWLSIVVSGLLMSLAFGASFGGLIGAAFGWPTVFAAIGSLSLLLVWANNCVWRKDDNANVPAPPPWPLSAAAVALRLAPTVVWSTAVYAMYTYLGSGLIAFGYSTVEIAEAILCYGCGAIAGVLIGGRMTDRFGVQLTSATGLAGLCCCLLLLRLALGAGMLVNLAFALASAAAQLFFPAQQVRLATEFPAQRSTILAWNNSALFLGISLGSAVGGQAVAMGGFDADLLISAAIAGVGWAISLSGRSAHDADKLQLTITQPFRSPRPSGTPGAT